MVNDDDKKYVNEVVWRDYSKDDSLEEILVDVVDDMGEYHNSLYKIRTHDEFVVAWVSKDLDNFMYYFYNFSSLYTCLTKRKNLKS